MLRKQCFDAVEQLWPRQQIDHIGRIGLAGDLTNAPLLPNGMGFTRMHSGWLLGWLLRRRNHQPITRDRQPSIFLAKSVGWRFPACPAALKSVPFGPRGQCGEARFRSAVIETDSYLLACYRYIELNPVRARMMQTPEDYPWSSYRCNALGTADPVIAPHPVYLDLADGGEARRSR